MSYYYQETLEEFLSHIHDVDTTLSLSSIPYGSTPNAVLGRESSSENHSSGHGGSNNYGDQPTFTYELGSGSGVESGRDQARAHWLRTLLADSDLVSDSYLNGEAEVIDLDFAEWLSDMETDELSASSASSLAAVLAQVEASDDSISNLLMDGLFVYEDDTLMLDALLNATVEQSIENRDDGLRGGPPAAKSVVENLPLVELGKEELKNGVVVCAVCNDETVEGEMVIKLPCCHYYHKDCILPWLKIRNTCPVCRYELPTDDQEYESQRRMIDARGLSINSPHE